MAKSEYIELHAHSHWSLLDGASSVEELVLRARELGYEALALTDHDGLYGAMEFAQTASAFGVRPIIGAEVTLANGCHLTLLCETQEGYANLCRLLSHAHLNSPRGQPALDPTVLGRHAPWYVALDKGYYKQEGLNVEIIPGKGTAQVIQALESGLAQFAFADVPGLILARPTGATSKMVAVNYQKAPYTIFSLDPGANVTKPEVVLSSV